ncbi:MAG: stress response translation initiation inhibitor YciH [Nanoarchaeota archaeon]|nr:stress response translation initiation inhibitor YciH [Nanoarchaeota archaeon]
MNEVCAKCGLSKELCVCETISKERETIRISAVARRFRKMTTVVEGLSKGSDPKAVLKELKTKLACGGTMKDGNVIELQGDHREKVKRILIKLGFTDDQIEVS